ncbi:hypothetical protein [Corynebacterium endometrii]|uniref:Uncharacterized protein n=1 Tax=Corynebacterium endometrii TaxID=2488819 RepID=A0A4V1CEA8_9CORY|nr:hypothetical protein [Corynebacterium endometrii]QCB27458.1 hypothetical protein CENDO_00740 [Corynebacterium endometrii]
MPQYDADKKNMTPAQRAAQDERTEDDRRNGRFVATEFATAPFNDFMMRLMAEELPMLDSTSRRRVYDILREYQASGQPQITSQEELPKEIRDIMDLY